LQLFAILQPLSAFTVVDNPLSTPLHDLNGALPSVGYADTEENVIVFFCYVFFEIKNKNF
jgi:hypothetical protein